MKTKCTNCSWESPEKLSHPFHCPVCGDNTQIIDSIDDKIVKIEESKKVEPVIVQPVTPIANKISTKKKRSF